MDREAIRERDSTPHPLSGFAPWEFERILVEQIHKVEERARDMQTGKHVPKPGS